VKDKFAFAVRAMRGTSTWKYIQPPHVRYSVAVLERGSDVDGYVVYRHVREPRGQVTLLVDFFADPDDTRAVTTLLRWVDREARRRVRQDPHIRDSRRLPEALKKSGYYTVKSTMEFVAKVNASR
jgi:hypothetical protein